MKIVTFHKLLSFAELAKQLPPGRGGKPVHPSTIHRWRRPGIRGVRLKAIRVGGYWKTSIEEFQEFCVQLSADGAKQAPCDAATDADARLTSEGL